MGCKQKQGFGWWINFLSLKFDLCRLWPKLSAWVQTWQPGPELCHQHTQMMSLTSVLADTGPATKHLCIYLKSSNMSQDLSGWNKCFFTFSPVLLLLLRLREVEFNRGGGDLRESKPHKGSTSPWNSAPHSLKAFDSLLWSLTFGMDRVS